MTRTRIVTTTEVFTISLLILVLAALGHVVLVRASLDWIYTKGLPQRLWHGLVVLHAAIAIAGPILLLRFVGQKGAGVLRGGAWADVSPAAIAYVAGCLIVLVVGVVVLLRRSCRSAPSVQRANHTVVRDAVVDLARVPAPLDLRGRVARLPGNQIFSIDVTERQLVLPRLPDALDGLSVLHLTDAHMNGTPDRAFFEWATELCLAIRPDLIAMTGDIIDHPGVADWLPSTLGRLVDVAPLGCFFVLGNHDLHVAPREIRDAMQRCGWESIAGRVAQRERRGQPILVAGTERPWAGAYPALSEVPALPGTSDARGEDRPLTILLSHSPHEVRWARRHGVDLMLAGHLHGGQIRLPLLGPMSGGRFASGLFDLPPTVLHVSRGLGQMMPLRWGCRPEITRLVLRSAGPA